MSYRYVIIDGNKYVVQSGTYIRRWIRQFSSIIAAGQIVLNFVDRGPGVRTYSMTLLLAQWPAGSAVYQDGITQTVAQQITNLEASYVKIATSLNFTDPFGNSPGAGGVYFTNMNEVIPAYSTVAKNYVLMEIELTESTQAGN